jgi:hypothetical protein
LPMRGRASGGQGRMQAWVVSGAGLPSRLDIVEKEAAAAETREASAWTLAGRDWGWGAGGQSKTQGRESAGARSYKNEREWGGRACVWVRGGVACSRAVWEGRARVQL